MSQITIKPYYCHLNASK